MKFIPVDVPIDVVLRDVRKQQTNGDLYFDDLRYHERFDDLLYEISVVHQNYPGPVSIFNLAFFYSIFRVILLFRTWPSLATLYTSKFKLTYICTADNHEMLRRRIGRDSPGLPPPCIYYFQNALPVNWLTGPKKIISKLSKKHNYEA
ncbi:MAG: hypothetical protein CVT94_07985 [Bacteroidetes bacterium HGW-Bacteroidetes-11]|nr:MAG: hypothetical protein CVT94_07985 [Bacteroidetes bacterium HGW-Bacteroidetes-11]